MRLAPDCVKKIEGLGDNESIRRGFRGMFEALANEATSQKLPASTMVMVLYDENSNIQPGEYAAELHLVVRKVEA